MSLWVWIVVVAGVTLFAWLLVVVIGTPGRRRAAQRERAAELRRQAEEKLASAARREVSASREEAAARRERESAQRALREAEAVDPDPPGPVSGAS